MLKAWFDKSICPIGVDIGARRIKLLQLRRVADGWSIIAASCRELPANAAEHRQATVETLRAAVSDAPFEGVRAVSCLQSGDMATKSLRLPKLAGAELERAIAWEAPERLGVDPESVRLQYFSAGEVRQGEELRQEVIVMAAANSVVDAHLNLLLDAGLKPAAIDVGPAALARWRQAQPGCSSAPEAVLDIGHACSNVMIMRGGEVVFFKPIELGGRRFDEDLAARLDLTPEEAHRLRWRGESTSDPSEAPLSGDQKHAISQSRQELGTELAREVALCLRYFSITFRGVRPEKLTIVGGGAYDPALAELIGEHSGVEATSTAGSVGLPDSTNDPARRLGDSGCEWPVASGLSMRPSAPPGLALLGRGAA